MRIDKKLFESIPEKGDVWSYTITNSSGASLEVLTLGARIRSLRLPDADGRLDDIVCGFDRASDYLRDMSYQGATIGRVGNRIENAEFTLNGVRYELYKNSNGIDSLHGGREGFDRKLWSADVRANTEGEASIDFSYTSPDGEEGYPGTLDVTVSYTFTEQNELRIRYFARTDKDTVINLTNHSYFNLDGYDKGSCVLEHRMLLCADEYCDVNDRLIPEGAPKKVAGTDFDFTEERAIGIPLDHHFVFGDYDGTLRYRGLVYSPNSKREVSVYTDMPGTQIYTAGGLDGDVPFKGGVPQTPFTAVCIETQFAPNSPNRPDFISCVLHKNEVWDHTTEFRFGIRK